MNTIEQKPLIIFTRTPLHVGAGSSVGAVDQPVQRERHTGHPIIPGSSIKGVIRARYYYSNGNTNNGLVENLFGKEPKSGEEPESQGHSGPISFSEARVLLFPVRSAKGSFAFVTCPLALSRFARDAALGLGIPDVLKEMECYAGSKVTFPGNPGSAVLEEYKFTKKGDFPEDWKNELTGLLGDPVLQGAKDRLVLLSDGDFAHFVMNSCEVQQHVKIDPETGTAEGGALYNEECVPSETLFYSVLTFLPVKNASGEDLKSIAIEKTDESFSKESILQFGGNNTTGLGFCSVKLKGSGNSDTPPAAQSNG